MEQNKKISLTEIDNLIIKIVLIIIIVIISFLVTLIIFKIAIENKLIFKLSDYI